jgi:hypothetical protein
MGVIPIHVNYDIQKTINKKLTRIVRVYDTRDKRIRRRIV